MSSSSPIACSTQSLKRKRSLSKERHPGHVADVPLKNRGLQITFPSSSSYGIDPSSKESSSGSIYSAIDSLFDELVEESIFETNNVLTLQTASPAMNRLLDPKLCLQKEINTEIIESSAVLSAPNNIKRKRSPSKEGSFGHTTDPFHKKPKLLRIVIPSSLNTGLEAPSSDSTADSVNSLFDDVTEDSSLATTFEDDNILAIRIGPPMSGLFFDPSVLLPQEIADAVVSFCMKTYFILPQDNQVMLFGRFAPSDSTTSGLPRILLELLETISRLLKPVIPPETYTLLFPDTPTRARQAIINLYQPGEGITPHVDLLGRYGDGIVGVSFSSGCAMRFDKVIKPQEPSGSQERFDVYLPERSMIVMTEEARYGWTHGIDKKMRDLVSPLDSSSTSKGVWVNRGTRMSVTFRWLLPGADVVGE